MSKEFLFSDGEGIDYNDLNNLQRLLRRELYDELLLELGYVGEPVPNGSVLRPFGPALAVRGQGAGEGRLIDILGGFGVWFGTGADPDYAKWPFYFAGAADVVIGVNALGGVRHDLVCARVQKVDGASESRDFKDATTGAITTQSMNKRRTQTLDYVVVAGTVVATDPNVPAGYQKIARLRLPNGFTDVLQTYVDDYRTPFGSALVNPPLPAGSQIISADTAPGWKTDGDPTKLRLYVDGKAAWFPLLSPTLRSPGWSSLKLKHMRLARLKFTGKLTTTAFAREAKIYRIEGGAVAGVVTEVLDATSIITSNTAGTYTIFDQANAPMGTTTPIWADGGSSPDGISGVAAVDPTLWIKIIGGQSGAPEDYIRGISAEWWGW